MKNSDFLAQNCKKKKYLFKPDFIVLNTLFLSAMVFLAHFCAQFFLALHFSCAMKISFRKSGPEWPGDWAPHFLMQCKIFAAQEERHLQVLYHISGHRLSFKAMIYRWEYDHRMYNKYALLRIKQSKNLMYRALLWVGRKLKLIGYILALMILYLIILSGFNNIKIKTFESQGYLSAII